jgi:hypothetical protein
MSYLPQDDASKAQRFRIDTAKLAASGIPYTVHGGHHYIVVFDGFSMDYWPGTGKYHLRVKDARYVTGGYDAMVAEAQRYHDGEQAVDAPVVRQRNRVPAGQGQEHSYFAQQDSLRAEAELDMDELVRQAKVAEQSAGEAAFAQDALNNTPMVIPFAPHMSHFTVYSYTHSKRYNWLVVGAPPEYYHLPKK